GNDSPDVTVLDPSGLSIGFIGHPGYVFDELENTYVTQQKLTFTSGDHQIKTGLQVKSSDFELFGGGNPNGSYLVQLDQGQLDQLAQAGVGSDLQPADLPADVQVLSYGIELRPNSFQKRQNILSVFLEDQWTVGPRFNLNIGLRYDYDDLSKGGGKQGDFNNLAPRLSANYALSDRSSIRAGYGIYYDKILYAVYSDALQFNSNSSDYKKQIQALIDQGVLPADTDIEAVTNEGNLVASADNVTYLQGPGPEELQDQRAGIFSNELRILNPDGYQNPYSHQIMLGFQHKASENTIFYLDLMHNRSYNLFRLRNLNAPAPYPIDPDQVLVRTPEEADLSRPIPIGSDAMGNFATIDGDLLRGVARNVVMTESAGRSNYYALNFTLQKERGADDYA
ncbi:MAG: TonB-dependent receptor, partial [Saprospiraceae bacterium]|nr:TonB-dependent receptor [Saprospiraceae bacterium]